MTPEGWRVLPLGEAATLQRGFDLPIQERREGPVPVVASNGPVGSHDASQVEGPGVVTGRSGTIGRVFYYETPFWPLNTTLYVSDFHGNDPRFVARLLEAFGLEKHTASTGVPTLNRNFVHPLPVLLPPLLEQRKIAAILSSVDDAIAATQAVIDQLGVVKKAMMAELLTRGLPGRHTRFKKTEIGEVPEGWKVVRLEEVLVEGPTNGLYKPAEKIGRGCLVAGMTAIDGATLDWSLCRRAELEAQEVSRFGLRQGDLLVTRVYARVDGIGRFIVVPEPPEPAAYESNMMRMRVQGGRASAPFVAAHMTLATVRREVEQRATLGAQASINSEALRSLPLRLPPMSEQLEIVAALDTVDVRIDAEARLLAQQRSCKAALMSVLLTGEVRVKPDEEIA